MSGQCGPKPVLITSKGKLITYTGIVEGFSTYYRMCSNCGLKYLYQKWTDGLRNFDGHLLMSLHMHYPAPFTPDSSCHQQSCRGFGDHNTTEISK